ncbi:helix-turn-helix transcriptional regulator [Proteiniborus sp. MB09-C3]|uniref:helix-turn-helix domain-containing protein n=1 Tax=Proteiniborus sp. MB09-C3 TaxID=3050072 RepID=UPI0025556183|nr:helix-turn-helix transcriptional regulator [Proteiniborus sp. MB09-C3]WIV11604.1 helix-turn-helix transcriptional regulator [Proteiniborus sp. MB09-C3]
MNELDILSPGQRLKEIRKKMKLRQGEIAGEKFSKNYISMFENNKRSINAINATYLSSRINEYAKIKGYDININASYFLKSDVDLARDKCEKWLEETEVNLKTSENECILNLSKTIHISSKYGLNGYRAKALYLKGIISLHNERYQCAMTQLLGALVYYAKENDFVYVSDIYEKIGIILYNKRELRQALVYFNLSYEITRNIKVLDRSKLEELNYYIALCYYEMEQYVMAQKMLGLIETNSNKISELANRINSVLAV